MKSILKKIIVNTIAIAVVAALISGLSYNTNVKTLIIAGFVLSLINLFLRPLIKALLLPINIITLGLAGWLVNVVILVIATYLVPGFSVEPFTLTLFGTSIIFSIFWSYIIVSFLLSFTSTLVNWILK